MRTAPDELARLIESGTERILDALRRAASQHLDADQLTGILSVDLSGESRCRGRWRALRSARQGRDTRCRGGERGGGEPSRAEALMLEEARQYDRQDLLRWGVGLLHRLAPPEMVAEEERRHRRPCLRVSETFDGGYELEGYLDPEGRRHLEGGAQRAARPALQE
jgi:hypothetical protein